MLYPFRVSTERQHTHLYNHSNKSESLSEVLGVEDLRATVHTESM